MAGNKKSWVMGILIALVVIMAIVLVYVLAVQPSLNQYAADRQLEGFQYAILSIMQQAATCQAVPLTAGNQTINVVAVDCLQQTQTSQ